MDFGREAVVGAKAKVYRMAYATPLVEERPLSIRAGDRVFSKLKPPRIPAGD